MADPRNIDDEIKKIQNLKNSYENLLDVEKRVNTAILYTTNTRKKYTDALSAAATVQQEILTKENKYSDQIRDNSAKLQKAYIRHKKLTDEKIRLKKEQKKLLASGKSTTEEYKKTAKDLVHLDKSIKENRESIKNYNSSIGDTIKSIEKLRGNASQMKKTFDSLKVLDNSDVSSYKDLEDYSKRRIAIMEKQIDIQEKSGALRSDEAKEIKNNLKDIENIAEIEGDYLKTKVSSGARPMVDELTKAAPGVGGMKQAQARKAMDLRGQQMGGFRSLLSTKSSFGDRMKAAESIKGIKGEFGKLNEIMSITGSKATGAAGMMKTLSTALGSLGKLGWVGLILQAVTAIGSAVNKLDKFLKGYNQTFAKLQGPTVLMKDFDKSADKFTDSIFNLSRNLKYGLKSDEIIGMFQGISEAGMSLQGVMKSIPDGYNRLIEQATKTSIDFGVSMEESGAMLGEQMTDLRSSLDEASEGFKVMSYNASIAGIQSQKFYQATYAAAEALSYYGKFLNTASTTLKNFQEQGGMGFKDAQQQTQEMTNLFKNMDKNMRVAFINMSGGVEAYRKDFIKMSQDSGEALKKQYDLIQSKRAELADAKARGDKDEAQRVQSEIDAAEKQMTTTEKTFAMASQAAKSNAQDMAMYLEMLSDKVGEKMADYLKTLRKQHGPDIFKDTRAVVEHMKAILPISDEFAMKMVGTLQTSTIGIKKMAHELEGVLDVLPTEEGKTKARSDIQTIIENGIKDGQMDLKAIRVGLEDYGKSSGIDVDTIMSNLEKFPNAVQELMKRGTKSVIDNVEDIALSEMKTTAQITGETGDEQSKRLDEIVKNTHTIEDFVGINKENAEYLLANNDIQKTMAKASIATARSTGSILHFVQKIWKKDKSGMTEEDFRSSDAYKKLGDLMTEEVLLSDKLKKSTNEDEKKDIKNRLEIIKSKKAATAGSNLYQEEELIPDVSKRATEILTEKEKAEKRILDLQKKIQTATALEKSDLNNSIKNIKKNYTDQYGNMAPLEPAPVDQKKDYKAATGGYALLSKGDVVVNAKSMSSGVGGDIGAFADTAMTDAFKGSKSIGVGQVNQAPTIPVQITIGSVNGDAEDFLKKIKPAIEQAFERMYFDKQKRR